MEREFERNGNLWILMGDIRKVEPINFGIFYFPSHTRGDLLHDYSIYAWVDEAEQWIHILNTKTYNEANNLLNSFIRIAERFKEVYEIVDEEEL